MLMTMDVTVEISVCFGTDRSQIGSVAIWAQAVRFKTASLAALLSAGVIVALIVVSASHAACEGFRCEGVAVVNDDNGDDDDVYNDDDENLHDSCGCLSARSAMAPWVE